MAKSTQADPLVALSDRIADHVAALAPSLVSLRGRRGPSSSGFVWRPGVVVTAEEALETDEEIDVVLPDGNRAGATLVGRDPSTDVAVLRVKAAPGVPAPLDGERELRPGELVAAVGRRPEGVTAHLGSLSLVGGAWRSLRGGRIDRRIEASVRLDPGSEGGLLMDARGRAVAMAVFGPRRRVLGIPAATIERVADHLLQHGRVRRGYLGVGLQPIRLDEAGRRLDPPQTRALMVVSVEAGGPAQQAGLLQGDVLATWNGEPIHRVRQVFERLGPDSVGATATLGIIRAGKPSALQVAIPERPNG